MWDKKIVSKSLGVLVFASYPRKSIGIARVKAKETIHMREYKKHPSKERLDELLRYEPETGKLYWKVDASSTTARGSEAGASNNLRYKEIGIDGVSYQLHNIVWLMNGRELPYLPNTLDHRDRNKLNNRIENLREATPRQQAINCLSRGFGWDKGKWSAKSRILDRRYIGRFPTALQARLAYEKATSEVEPEFASTFFTDAFNELITSAS